MDDLKQAIKQARNSGLDDTAIRNLLTKSGWDTDIADAALKGIFIPAPTQPVYNDQNAIIAGKHRAGADHAAETGPKLSSLEAAVHHVLLWFFTGSLTCTIGFVTATLFGSDQSISAVSTFLATSVITLAAYGYFYARYLGKFRQDPSVTTNKVWSIITIVLHSVGAMAALITLVAVAINAPEEGAPIFVAAALIALLDGLVVATYAHATFVESTSARRKAILRIFPVIITLMLALLIVLSVGKVGPLRADERLRQDMVNAAETVRDVTEDTKLLPTDSSGLGLPAGVAYERESASSYRLCGNFKTTSGDSGYGSSSYNETDDHVSTYSFRSEEAGRQCFTLDSAYIKNIQLENQLDSQSNVPASKELPL